MLLFVGPALALRRHPTHYPFGEYLYVFPP